VLLGLLLVLVLAAVLEAVQQWGQMLLGRVKH
jgi:hypothetical protein